MFMPYLCFLSVSIGLLLVMSQEANRTLGTTTGDPVKYVGVDDIHGRQGSQS